MYAYAYRYKVYMSIIVQLIISIKIMYAYYCQNKFDVK